MRKKTSPTQLGFNGSVALYRDDLDEIITTLSKVSEKVFIEDNEYQYDSLDDLLEKRGSSPRQLSIYSREPLVIFNVRIKPGHTTLATSGDGDNLPPYFQIKQLLESRKRKGLSFLFSGPPLLVFTILMFLLWTSLDDKFAAAGPLLWIRVVLIASLLLSAMILEVYYSWGAFSVISLKKKHEQESFWSKNRDAIVVGLILSLLSSLLTFMVAYVLFRQGIK